MKSPFVKILTTKMPGQWTVPCVCFHWWERSIQSNTAFPWWRSISNVYALLSFDEDQMKINFYCVHSTKVCSNEYERETNTSSDLDQHLSFITVDSTDNNLQMYKPIVSDFNLFSWIEFTEQWQTIQPENHNLRLDRWYNISPISNISKQL